MEGLIGQSLGQCRIVERIGAGGMATVFKAYQPGPDRYVAIKVLPPFHADQPGFGERFAREARAIANLHHPNILPVHDSGQERGYSFIVMRYVEGARTLGEVMKEQPDLATVADVIGQVAAALDHAHGQGIIHRDVKPSNVLMDGDWALLTDFGLAKMTEATAKLTGSGVGVGTPAYMSPEQGQGKGVDHRTDVYSLGIILFEALTGQIPHDAETPFAIILKRMSEPLPLPRSLNPQIPEAVERVILKALAREPGNRFDSAGAMAAALKQAVSGVVVEEVKAPPPVVEEPPTVPAPEPEMPTPVHPEVERAPIPPPLAVPIPARPGIPWKLLAGVGAVVVVVVVVLIIALAGGGKPTPTPTSMPEGAALVPTATPTASPTDTQEPTPTNTPPPMDTPRPTDTPVLPTDTPPPPAATNTPMLPTDTSRPTDTPVLPTDTPPPTVAPVAPTDTPIPPTPALLSLSTSGRIAFESFRDGNWEIYVMNADGSNQTRLTNNPAADDRFPSWSPDGSRIAFASKHEIYVMNADGSNQTRLTNNPAYYSNLSWSPDGSRIAFQFWHDDNKYEIYVMNADGSGQTNLTNNPASDWHPSWSPDASRIAFYSSREGNGGIYVMNADGSEQTRLTTGGSNPSWSPDGTRILFESYRDGNEEIYVMNADGSEQTRLTDNPANDFGPSWSPNGTRILFDSHRDGNEEIYVMNADGSEQTRLTNDPEFDGSPSWRP
jgi:serine/threonine protein kinase